MKENKNYQLIPNDDAGDESQKAWNIRILTGEFVETVIGNIVLSTDEKKKQISFAFDVISTPNESATPDNAKLQSVVASIIADIILEDE